MFEQGFELRYENEELTSGADIPDFQEVFLTTHRSKQEDDDISKRDDSGYLGLTSAISGYLALIRVKKAWNGSSLEGGNGSPPPVEMANGGLRMSNGRIGRRMKVVEGGGSWMKVKNFSGAKRESMNAEINTCIRVRSVVVGYSRLKSVVVG